MTIDHEKVRRLALRVLSEEVEVGVSPEVAAEEMAQAYIDLEHEYRHTQCRLQAQNIELLNAVAQLQQAQIQQAGKQVVTARPNIGPLDLRNNRRG